MYLTQFEFNTRRRGSRLTLASPQRVHAAVLSCFPAEESATGRILWRLDHLDNSRRQLMIMSPARPDLTALNEECGWPTTSGWRTADASRLLDTLAAGQHWRFRLTANPVRSVAVPGGPRGVPVPLAAHQQLDWLLERAERCGVRWQGEGIGAVVTRRETLVFRRNGSNRVTLSVAQFDGRLEVVDPSRLREVLTQGIGRAKGYGCGLLTLTR